MDEKEIDREGSAIKNSTGKETAIKVSLRSLPKRQRKIFLEKWRREGSNKEMFAFCCELQQLPKKGRYRMLRTSCMLEMRST